jgi:hypothetical protein
MPFIRAGRPLKRWRYVAFFSPQAVISVAKVRIGPLRDAFWAVWDREERRLWKGAGPTAGLVKQADGRAAVRAPRVQLELEFAEVPGVETVCASGRAYGWTRKQGGLPATARLRLGGRQVIHHGHVLIDDTVAYYERHTHWRWSAGAGRTPAGQVVAWSLVSGVNDPTESSERTVWVDGVASEAPDGRFADDLSAVGELRFAAEATLARQVNLGVVRSAYRQPIGSFSGHLPGGIEVAEGYGVMEDHDAWW